EDGNSRNSSSLVLAEHLSSSTHLNSLWRRDCVRLLLFGSIVLLTEAVRPVPPASRRAVDIDTGTEPAKLSGPVREGAQSEICRQIERATADRPVSVPCVEDDVTVQQARRNTSRLVIEDMGADLDLREVRGRERAKGTSGARVLRALLRQME